MTVWQELAMWRGKLLRTMETDGEVAVSDMGTGEIVFQGIAKPPIVRWGEGLP